MPIVFCKASAEFALKDISAPTLASKGLSFLSVTDAINTASYDTTDPQMLFQPNPGNRHQQDTSTGPVPDRWSIGTHYGKKCLRTDFRAGEIAELRYGSLWLPTQYSELGFRASVYIPSSFSLVNNVGADINGKTMFGIAVGPSWQYQPGQSWAQDQVEPPCGQEGGTLGLNLAFDQPNSVRFVSYLHVPGAKGTGGVWREREHRFSHLSAIPGYQQDDGIQGRYSTSALPLDQWFRIEVYAKMDTNLNVPNGAFETWIERNGTMVKEQWAYDLDLGGAVGDRPALGMQLRADSGNGLPDANGPQGPLWSSTGGGWGLHGIFARDMLGGGYTTPYIPVSSSHYCAADWALYGKV